ncbi:di-trans,poly-cis-decaprenylcistransferase, partial [Clostridium saudiense]|nr:di-trans,poly-cis-decaprenylcistransferase [Clostridium saudiense]
MLKLFKKDKENKEEIQIDFDNIPKHIAIIMDGNGRWAKQRKLPRSMGHKAGVETIRRILKEADRLGVKYITLYAFSTENWKRPKEEVDALMKLLVQYLTNEVEGLHRNGVVLRILGDINALPGTVKEKIYEAIDLTKNNKGIVLNVAFNYG